MEFVPGALCKKDKESERSFLAFILVLGNEVEASNLPHSLEGIFLVECQPIHCALITTAIAFLDHFPIS